MAEWFIMVVIASKLAFVGPFNESECRSMKRLMFAQHAAVCVPKSLLDAQNRI